MSAGSGAGGGATVHLVRHGETLWHAENRYAGRTDVALTARGGEQALALARWAGGQPVTRVLCSDLTRAVVTARPCAEALGLDLEVDPRLREVDFGRGEGMTAAEMDAAFPEERRRFTDAPASSPLPGGEAGADAVARAAAVLAGLDGGEVLVVAHTTLGRLLLCHLLGLPLDDYRRRFPALANGAVTTLRLPPAGAELRGAAALLRLNAPV